MKTPITYYGGKQRMLQHILPLIPQHTVYNEPYCGGAAVFFAKAPSGLEIINDLNEALITFYRVAQSQPDALIRKVKETLHSRRIHAKAWEVYSHCDLHLDVDIAWAVWVLSSQGFGGEMGKGWGYDKSERKSTKKIQNTKFRFDTELLSRLEYAQIECKPALDVISRYDSFNTFHYVDPPYFNSDCGHYAGYSAADFIDLLNILGRINGRFLLSSYPSDILANFVAKHGWNQKVIRQPVSVNGISGKSRTKQEVLTANYPI